MIELWLNLLVFIAGFVILVKGADTFIEYAGQLGTRLGMKKVIVGLILVSMGTSLPELAISVFAIIQGSSSVSLGNIIGSNIANIALFLGFAGIAAARLTIKKNILTKEIPLMILSFILFYLFMTTITPGIITSLEGIILLTIFAVYIFYLFKFGAKEDTDPLIKELKADPRIRMPKWKITLYTCIGLLGLLLGSNVLVDASIEIAKIMGIDEAVIALTAVAVGTSIPDVTASLVALRKKEPQIGFGNIVGSGIFNTLLVGGITATVFPLEVAKVLEIDALLMIILSVLLLPFILSNVKLTPKKSYVILGLYFAYLLFVLLR